MENHTHTVNGIALVMFAGDVVQCAAGQAAPGNMRCIEKSAVGKRISRGMIIEPVLVDSSVSSTDDPLACKLHKRQKCVVRVVTL